MKYSISILLIVFCFNCKAQNIYDKHDSILYIWESQDQHNGNSIYVSYLDIIKQPLQKSIIVWQSIQY